MSLKHFSAGAALAAAAALSAGSASAQDKTLTVSVYAFAQDEFKEIVYDPFEKLCGCKLVVETGNSVERLAKMEANAAKPVVDVAAISLADALAASRKDLLATIDPAKVPNIAKVYESGRDPLGNGQAVGYTYYATSIVYRSDKVQVDSWSDLLGPELAGNVAFPDVTTNQGPPSLYMLGIAMGDDSTSLEAPIKAVGEHAGDIVTFYVKSSQLSQLMQQEEIWAAPIGRFAWAQFKKMDLPLAWATPKEGQTGGLNVLVMTKGNGHEELAQQFIDFWLSTEIQTALAEKLIDSPANAEVKVSDEVADNLTYGAETIEGLKLIPAEALLDNRDAWLKAWNEQVVQ